MERTSLILAAFVILASSFCLAGSESTVSGTYVNKANKEYLTLYPDGTLHLKLRNRSAAPDNPFIDYSGRYTVTGEDIKLQLVDGGEASGKIQGNAFVDNEGISWVKEGTSKPPQIDTTPKKGMRMK
jgi:hypothetical protein